MLQPDASTIIHLSLNLSLSAAIHSEWPKTGPFRRNQGTAGCHPSPVSRNSISSLAWGLFHKVIMNPF